ncbi:hypothetical protein GIX45_23470 [Erwinia sp. CPCC 100877]|nr:hypothetical protein [Erwinia sp. CPCC 100877]
MYTFGYVIEEGFLTITRKKGPSLFRFIFGMLYSLFFILLARGWLTFIRFENSERENALKNNNPLNALTKTNADQSLITFLGILKYAILIISLAMLVFAFFYLFSFLQKQFLLEKNDLKIKAYLGSSPLKITGELFSPIVLVLALGGICGFLCGNYLYFLLYKKAVWWIKEVLEAPTYYLLIVDMPFILLMTMLLGAHFLFLKQKIAAFH